MSEQPSTIDAIFCAAIEIAEPEARRQYVREACKSNPSMQDRVERLLAAHDRAGGFLAAPAPEVAELARSVRAIGLQPGEMVGSYRVVARIGEGGLGEVYRVEQLQPVRRVAAMKVIKVGMDTRQVIARFDAERQALAVMDHPGIARVLDAGSTPSGMPYFVMELVDGEPITRFCDRNSLSIAQRLELFEQVCLAVQHAHQKGVIHRDIKPSNVLVTTVDGKPMVKVIDFGIAKATQSRLTEKTLFTEARQLVGTPEYMSPEQAAGTVDIDTRSDVYSLGVLLYELLVGAPPFDGSSLREKAYEEMQRIIREVDPPAPSTRLSTLETLASVAASRSTEPRRLGASISGELDWIVMKAMEKDRARRYDSPSSLAMDIGRHLADQPVSAGPPSRVYRLEKFIRRHKTGVATSVAMFLLLVAGVVGTTIGLIGKARQGELAMQRGIEAQRQGEEARKQAAVAKAIAEFQTSMFQSADPRKLLGDKLTVVQLLSGAVQEMDNGKLADQPEVEAEMRYTIGSTFVALGRYDLAEPNLKTNLEILRRLHPPGSAHLARGVDALGRLYYEQGRYPAAEMLMRESLEISRGYYPAVHREVAVSMNNLGSVLVAQGKLEEGELVHWEALELYRKLYPAGHRETASSLNNVALVLHRRGRHSEAEPLCREALEIRRKVFPEGHPAIASGVGNLAEVLRMQGKLDEAEALHREALQIRRAALPADHPDIALSLNNLGLVMKDSKRLEEAADLLRQSLDMRRMTLGRDHPDIATALNNLASVLLQQGKPQEAEPLFREGLEMYRRRLSAGHEDIAVATSNLALSLKQHGRFGDAETLLLEAEETLSASAGVLPARRDEYVEELVELYVEWDKAEPGKGYAEKALQWKTRLSTTQPTTRPATRP